MSTAVIIRSKENTSGLTGPAQLLKITLFTIYVYIIQIIISLEELCLISETSYRAAMRDSSLLILRTIPYRATILGLMPPEPRRSQALRVVESLYRGMKAAQSIISSGVYPSELG